MKKYYRPVNKFIDFLKNKKEDIEIEAYFIQQLKKLNNYDIDDIILAIIKKKIKHI